jgi:hypothetical protein
MLAEHAVHMSLHTGNANACMLPQSVHAGAAMSNHASWQPPEQPCGICLCRVRCRLSYCMRGGFQPIIIKVQYSTGAHYYSGWCCTAPGAPLQPRACHAWVWSVTERPTTFHNAGKPARTAWWGPFSFIRSPRFAASSPLIGARASSLHGDDLEGWQHCAARHAAVAPETMVLKGPSARVGDAMRLFVLVATLDFAGIYSQVKKDASKPGHAHEKSGETNKL